MKTSIGMTSKSCITNLRVWPEKEQTRRHGLEFRAEGFPLCSDSKRKDLGLQIESTRKAVQPCGASPFFEMQTISELAL